jgi:hypothetical protein
VIYDENTQVNLRNWALSNKIDLTKKYNGELQKVEDFEFHTKIYYSINSIYMTNRVSRIYPSGAFFDYFDLFGNEKDIPVIRLQNMDAISQMREFFSGYDMKEDWPVFAPHISLSYARQKIDLDSLTKPNFDLIFDRVIVEDIEE